MFLSTWLHILSNGEDGLSVTTYDIGEEEPTYDSMKSFQEKMLIL